MVASRKEFTNMSEETKRISVQMPAELHKTIKQIVLDNDISIKNYIINLIKADIEEREKNKKE